MEKLKMLKKMIQEIDKKNWKKVKFGDVCHLMNHTARKLKDEGYLHVVGLEHIEPNNLHIHDCGSTEDETTFTRIFRKGQVLFGRRRAYQRKVAYAEFDGICSGDIMVFEAIKEKLLPELLPFIVQSEGFFNCAVDTSAGSLSPRTKFADLANYQFLLPPKEEQAHFAELLWAADEVVERYFALIKAQNDLFIIMLKNFFDNTTMPKRKLSDVATIVMGQSPDGKSYNENGDGMLFLQGNAEFTDTYPIAYKYTNQPNKIAKQGDILMSVRAPVGEINITDKMYCIGRGLCSISMKTGDNNYLKYFLLFSRKLFEKQSTGSTFKAINSDIIKNIKIPFGIEMGIIAKKLDYCEQQIKQIKEQIFISQQLKSALINQIF